MRMCEYWIDDGSEQGFCFLQGSTCLEYECDEYLE